MRENESLYIIATQWRRLQNPGKTTLEIIEVQSGDYLGNAGDIVRGDDAYNRAPEELSSLGFHETFWLFPNEADSAPGPG